jgi:hypothetical protein
MIRLIEEHLADGKPTIVAHRHELRTARYSKPVVVHFDWRAIHDRQFHYLDGFTLLPRTLICRFASLPGAVHSAESLLAFAILEKLSEVSLRPSDLLHAVVYP